MPMRIHMHMLFHTEAAEKVSGGSLGPNAWFSLHLTGVGRCSQLQLTDKTLKWECSGKPNPNAESILLQTNGKGKYSLPGTLDANSGWKLVGMSRHPLTTNLWIWTPFPRLRRSNLPWNFTQSWNPKQKQDPKLPSDITSWKLTTLKTRKYTQGKNTDGLCFWQCSTAVSKWAVLTVLHVLLRIAVPITQGYIPIDDRVLGNSWWVICISSFKENKKAHESIFIVGLYAQEYIYILLFVIKF